MSAVHNLEFFPVVRLDRYVLRRELARGGMARVYLAQYDAPGGFEKWVAVKVIHEHLARDRRLVNMLLDEARVSSRIQHPNVCSVLDFGGANTTMPYIVMEYIHGEPLTSVTRFAWPEGRLPFWLSARIIADVARGLHSAHELKDARGESLGIVHRDVSPQNIMVDYHGVTKLLDFGIARARGRIVETGSFEIKGKFAYMAPEQLEGAPIDRRVDIWSLAVILWEATVGTHLFRGRNDGETTLNVVSKQIPRPSDLVKGYPYDLEWAIMAALNRNPDKRTATAAEFADALDGYLGDLSLRTGPERVSRWMRNTFAKEQQTRERLLSSPIPPAFDEESTATDMFEEESTAAAVWTDDLDSKAGTNPVPTAEELWALQTVEGSSRRFGAWVAIVTMLTALTLGFLVFWPIPDLLIKTPPLIPTTETETETGPETGTETETETETETGTETETVAEIETVAETETGPETETVAETGTESETETEAETMAETETVAETGRETTATVPATDPNSAPAPALGRLTIKSQPNARVYLRGRLLGTTPIYGLKLQPGNYKLQLKVRRKHKTISVRLRPDELTRRVVKL